MFGKCGWGKEQFTNYISVQSFIVCLFSDLIDHELHKINYDAKKYRFIAEQKRAQPSRLLDNGNNLVISSSRLVIFWA